MKQILTFLFFSLFSQLYAQEGYDRPYEDPKKLPETIKFKTDFQTYNAYEYYALCAGKLYIKKKTEKAPWQVREETNGVIALAADDDEVIIATKASSMSHKDPFNSEIELQFRRLHRNMKYKSDQFYDAWGSPVRGNNYVPETFLPLRMSLSRRRFDSIGYYQDRVGNVHYSGQGWGSGVTTVSILSADGNDIRVADPGLPAGFSLRQDLPENFGKIVAIASSGSVHGILSATGKVKVKLSDFDIDGGNVAMNYQWDDTYQKINFDPNYVSARVLPAEDWNEIAPYPTEIETIYPLLNMDQYGQGNLARTLIFLAKNVRGESGRLIYDLQTKEYKFEVENENDFFSTTQLQPINVLEKKSAQENDRELLKLTWEGQYKNWEVQMVKSSLESKLIQVHLQRKKDQRQCDFKLYLTPMWAPNTDRIREFVIGDINEVATIVAEDIPAHCPSFVSKKNKKIFELIVSQTSDGLYLKSVNYDEVIMKLKSTTQFQHHQLKTWESEAKKWCQKHNNDTVLAKKSLEQQRLSFDEDIQVAKKVIHIARVGDTVRLVTGLSVVGNIMEKFFPESQYMMMPDKIIRLKTTLKRLKRFATFEIDRIDHFLENSKADYQNAYSRLDCTL